MLSRLDEIIYPNRCEVIEIVPSQRYIYPIFKNGSSSITENAKEKRYKVLFNEQLRRIDTIDIVLRDPQLRFVSGINTFVYNIKRDHPNLDEDTIIYFAETYLFLNRHYSPQMSWLVNLSRYIRNDTKLRFGGMESLYKYTPLSISPDEEKIFSPDVINRLQSNIHNDIYIRLDNCLVDLIGQQLTYTEVLEYIKNKDPHAHAKLS